MFFTPSSPRTRPISFEHLTSPKTDVIKSRAFATTSSRLIGFSGVPRTCSTRSLSCVPSLSVTSTTATRIGISFSSSSSGISCTFDVVRCAKAHRFVEKHYRNHVLQTNVRHFTVVHREGCAGCGPHNHFLHLFRLELVAFLQDFQSVQWRLNGPARRPLLQRRQRDLVSLAELIGEPPCITFGRVRLHKVPRAGEDVIHSRPPGFHQQRRSHAVA